MATPEVLEFLEFLDIAKKADLKAFADKVLVRQRDLVGLILASDTGAVPIGHMAIHRHYHPPELTLTDENLAALSSNGVGGLSPGAQKTVNKVMQTFKQRRLFNAHFFWLIDYPSEWHLFYFDQRDTTGEHWVGGAHIHLMNHVTHPRINAGSLLQEIHEGEKPPKLSGFHLRYERS